MRRKIYLIVLIFLITTFGFAQEGFPRISIGISPAEKPSDLVLTLEILLLLTVLTVAPSILLLFTSFTRIIVVFSFLRNGLGTRQSPPNQVLIGLALFLTFLIMQPVWSQIYDDGIKPYLDGEISYKEMFVRVYEPVRQFMIRQLKVHRNEDNVFMLAETLNMKIEKLSDAPPSILIPAFVLGELEIAFKMGIILYLPFILIDMLVASILLAMGMIMVPPILISLPFKVLLFVAVNGWDLLTRGLVQSF